MPRELPGIGQVYDLDEVISGFGVSRSTVLRNYRAGKLRGQRFGRSIFFTAESMRTFLEGRAKPQAEPARRTTPPTNADAANLAERGQIIEAMKRSGNYREEAAKIMQVSTVWLRQLIKKHGLEFPSNKGRKYETKPLFKD